MPALEFSFGMPVTGEYFYNRKEELKLLLSRVEKIKKGLRNDIAIIGPRRVGKSSLTIKLVSELKNTEISTMEIDCEGLTLAVFLREYSNAIIEDELKRRKLDHKFKEAIRNGVSATISMLSEILGRVSTLEIKSPLVDFISLRIEIEKAAEGELKGEKLYDFFSKTIELPEKLGRKYIMLLDEFQETATYTILRKDDFHALFRRAIQNQKNVCYIYTGSSIGMMEEIFGNPKNPLAGNADILRLGPFDRKNSRDFIVKGLQTHNKEIDETALDLITDQTGGFPSYLNWIGLRLSQTRKTKIDKKDVEKELEEMLGQGSAIYQLISKQLTRLGPKTKRVLAIIALGNDEPRKIQKESGAKNIYVYLRRLQNYGLLKKEENKFYLFDPVMAKVLSGGMV